MTNPTFLIAFFATIVRYYDYAIFGLSAATLSKNFLPSESSDKQLLLFFAIFSLAVVTRPIGSIIFGFISDKHGRVVSVRISIFLATISTILIGIMPNFASIGILATISLTFCRMIFLISLAGEVDTIKIYIVEKVGKSYKNYASSIVSCCSQAGALLAAICYHFSIEYDQIQCFGQYLGQYFWRINFIIGGIAGLVIIIRRHSFQESEEFLNCQKDRKFTQPNFWELKNIIKKVLPSFIVALLISGCTGAIYHFLIIFWGVFTSKIILITNAHQAQIMTIILIIIYAVMAIFSGFLADRFNPKKQIITSVGLSILVIIIIQFSSYNGMFLGIFLRYFPLVIIALAPFYIIPLQIIIQSLFTTNIRARMCGLSHSLGGTIISSTTPFFCMLLWQYNNSVTLVLGYFLLLLLLLFVSVIYLYNNIIER
jgi:MFS family permease